MSVGRKGGGETEVINVQYAWSREAEWEVTGNDTALVAELISGRTKKFELCP